MESNKKNKEFRKILNNELQKERKQETKIHISLKDCGGFEGLFPEPKPIIRPVLMVTKKYKKYLQQKLKQCTK